MLQLSKYPNIVDPVAEFVDLYKIYAG